MEIKTKFDIGDSIFFMRENKVYEFKVHQICITKFKNGESTIVYVDCSNPQSDDITDESKPIFSSKQELLDSL